MHNYLVDPIGKECLFLAEQCKAEVGFGAVLVQDGEIIGRGRNRRATKEDRGILSHVDYAIHAEQDCILQAIKSGRNIRGAAVYVLGKSLIGQHKGKLTTRTRRVFICHKCPHAFIQWNIHVFIPHVDGWKEMTGEEALASGKLFYHKGYWKAFAKSPAS